MFVQIGGSNDDLCKADAVVRDVNDFNQVAYRRVVVDDFGNVVNQTDDFLRHVIGGCGFTGKDEHTRLPIEIRVFQDFVVAVDDVHHVQCLTFVLVDTFDLDVEKCIGINFNAQLGFDVFGKALFGGFFHFTEFCLYGGIVHFIVELGQVVQMQTPVFVAQMFVQEIGQARIGDVNPASWGHAVGYVGKAFGEHFGKVGEDGSGHQVGVDFRHAVDFVRTDDRQPCHADAAAVVLIDDGHAADEVAIHLNDTHPVLAIPELMRILIDEEGIAWTEAWNMCCKIFSYNNHTLMSEALETWPVDLMGRLLPRHLDIIFEINAYFLNALRAIGNFDDDFVRRVSIIDENNGRRVRMAWLAVIGSHKVNGVAKIHSDLMTTSIFADFAKVFPERFTNVTNGVTPRRWINIANPPLTAFLDKHLGEDDWRLHLDNLTKLNEKVDDTRIQNEFAKVKKAAKTRLARYIENELGIKVSTDALFDVQIKRIHEYKRQALNVMHIVDRYNKILENPDFDWQPRVFVFSGKAASAYYMAKKIIRLINDVAKIINNDERIRDLIKVVYIPNYSVSLAEIIIPAADLHEQISLAGTEASGTSNMKFALNGALCMGTLDGANVEILEKVGADNCFIFGNTVEQVEEIRRNGYDPLGYIERDNDLRRVVNQISNGTFSPEEPNRYNDVLQPYGDYYQLMADFRSYIDTQYRADEHYRNAKKWRRSALINIANMGFFSSDRSIVDYCRDIWFIKPLTEKELPSSDV